jgi:hypothetical protein
MAHAGILVNTAWQATVIEAFLQVMQRPAGSKAAAVAAAEAPCGSAEDVVAAAAAEQQQQQKLDGCGHGSSQGGTTALVDAAAAIPAQQQQCDAAGGCCEKQQQQQCNAAGDCCAKLEQQQQQHKRNISAASSADADAYSVDTDDTAWESMHAAEGFVSCGSGVKSSQRCSSCNCLNCQLFPTAAAVLGSSSSSSGGGSSDDLEGHADRVCSDVNAAATAVGAADGSHVACKGTATLPQRPQQQQQQHMISMCSVRQQQGSYLNDMSDV